VRSTRSRRGLARRREGGKRSRLSACFSTRRRHCFYIKINHLQLPTLLVEMGDGWTAGAQDERTGRILMEQGSGRADLPPRACRPRRSGVGRRGARPGALGLFMLSAHALLTAVLHGGRSSSKAACIYLVWTPMCVVKMPVSSCRTDSTVVH
jgi:hypothetical protein